MVRVMDLYEIYTIIYSGNNILFLLISELEIEIKIFCITSFFITTSKQVYQTTFHYLLTLLDPFLKDQYLAGKIFMPQLANFVCQTNYEKKI